MDTPISTTGRLTFTRGTNVSYGDLSLNYVSSSQLTQDSFLLPTGSWVGLKTSSLITKVTYFANQNTSSNGEIWIAKDSLGAQVITQLVTADASQITWNNTASFYARAFNTASWLDYKIATL